MPRATSLTCYHVSATEIRPPGKKSFAGTARSCPRQCDHFGCKTPTHSMQCRQPGYGWPKTPTGGGIQRGWAGGSRPPPAVNAYASCAISHPPRTSLKRIQRLSPTPQLDPNRSPSRPTAHAGYGNTSTSCHPVTAPYSARYSPTMPAPMPRSLAPPESRPAQSGPPEREPYNSYETDSTKTSQKRNTDDNHGIPSRLRVSDIDHDWCAFKR